MIDRKKALRLHKFMGLHRTTITEDKYKELIAKTPKRKRFCDATEEVIRTSSKTDDDGLYLNFHFEETIQPILASALCAHFFPNKFGYGARIESEKREMLESFVEQFNQTVFIRSLLPCMIALDMNFKSNSDEYTEIGKHEHEAKENNVQESSVYLTNEIVKTIKGLPFYQHADGIVCIPPSTGKKTCLPKTISKGVAEALGISDFTEKLKFVNKDKSLQNEAVNEKWSTLVDSELIVEDPNNDLTGKVVILLDDLYQSGSTMHYATMKLQQAGTAHVLGIAVVKSRRDDDNTEKE
jgi:hypothetical protein